MGVLLANLIVLLFLAMGLAFDVDEVFEAIRHPVAHGRHGTGDLSLDELRARCAEGGACDAFSARPNRPGAGVPQDHADTLPYYPAPQAAAGAETDAPRPAPAALHQVGALAVTTTADGGR